MAALTYYKKKQLTVNGEAVPQEWLVELPTGRYTVKMGREVLPESDGHLMQTDNRRGPRNFSVVVKPGHYFMMGDNRENSQDSRFWGFLDINKVKGRAFVIYWSWDRETSWFRIERLGLGLQDDTPIAAIKAGG